MKIGLSANLQLKCIKAVDDFVFINAVLTYGNTL